MVQVVQTITELEAKNNLFSLRDNNGMPVWDVIRYDVIKHIQYHYNPNKETVPQTSIRNRIQILFRCLTPFLRLLYKGKKRVLFFVHSRHQNVDGRYYDRQAIDLINLIPQKDRFIIDSSHAGNCEYKAYKVPQAFFYAWFRIKHSFFRRSSIEQEVVRQIQDAINNGFGETVIDFNSIISIYEHFIALCEMFDWILGKIKPERIIISYGRYKALSYSAKNHKIPSYLIQHSLIDRADATIGGTCPKKEDGVNPDTLLTYGSYWGDYLKHLMNVKVLGNRYLYKDSGERSDDGTVLFVSSLYQGPYLSKLLLEYAPMHTDTEFIYKLHSGESSLREHYEHFFSNITNVSVQLNEESMAAILQRCSLVVLISSTTLFEALNAQKCVAIYDIPEFSDVTSFLKGAPNTYCFKNTQELESIINSQHFVVHKDLTYYDDFKKSVAKEALGI